MARTWVVPAAVLGFAGGAAIAAYIRLRMKAQALCAANKLLVEKMVSKEDSSVTTGAIISAFEADPTFQAFSRRETADILKRDADDGEKLAAGIKMAVAKGVLEANPPVENTMKIDVLGKSADQVAGAIMEKLGDAPQKGCILVLQGLSGTGKGTTVANLQAALPKCVSWSNGNVFRSLTLLAVTKCEQNKQAFGEEALTPALLKECMGYLKFGKFKGGKFDIHICGLGLDLFVSEVANTTLKEPKVGKNIPTGERRRTDCTLRRANSSRFTFDSCPGSCEDDTGRGSEVRWCCG